MHTFFIEGDVVVFNVRPVARCMYAGNGRAPPRFKGLAERESGICWYVLECKTRRLQSTSQQQTHTAKISMTCILFWSVQCLVND